MAASSDAAAELERAIDDNRREQRPELAYHDPEHDLGGERGVHTHQAGDLCGDNDPGKHGDEAHRTERLDTGKINLLEKYPACGRDSQRRQMCQHIPQQRQKTLRIPNDVEQGATDAFGAEET